jgi:hypothetical protein
MQLAATLRALEQDNLVLLLLTWIRGLAASKVQGIASKRMPLFVA